MTPPRSMARSLVASGLLALGLLLALPTTTATAATPMSGAVAPTPLDPAGSTPAPAESGQVTFGVQPSGPDEPDERPAYTYEVATGTSFTDHFAISNFSARPLTLDVYGSDAINTADGGYDLLAADTPSTDAGLWVRLDERQVTVPGRSRVVLPFRVDVPANASPGDHAAGIVASLPTTQADEAGNRVRVDQRVGARLNVRVDGALTPSLSVEALTVEYRGTRNPVGRGTVTMSYQVRNTGNVRLSAEQTVQLDPLLGGRRIVEVESDVPDLLPGSVVPMTVTTDAVAPTGLIRAEVTLDPTPTTGPLDGRPLLAVRDRATFLAAPVTLLGLLLVLAGLLVERRRRRRRRTRPALAPHTGGTRALRTPAAATPARRGTQVRLALALSVPGLLLLPIGPTGAQERPVDGPVLANLTFRPVSGDQDTAIDLSSPVTCPRGADNVLAVVRGPGFPVEGYNVIGNTPVTAYSGAQDGTLLVPVAQRMSDFARQQATPFDLVGTYEFVVICRRKLDPTSLGNMIGTLVFDADSRYALATPRVVIASPEPPGIVARSAPDAAASPLTAGADAPVQEQAAPGAVPIGPEAGPTSFDRAGAAGEGRQALRLGLLAGGLLLVVVAASRAARPLFAARRRSRPAR